MITQMDIKLKRISLDLSQRALAVKAGVGLTSVNRIESKEHGPGAATTDIIKKIFGALEIPYSLNDDGIPIKLKEAN